jgi:hypothetical protein
MLMYSMIASLDGYVADKEVQVLSTWQGSAISLVNVHRRTRLPVALSRLPLRPGSVTNLLRSFWDAASR